MKPICIPQVLYGDSKFIYQTAWKLSFLMFFLFWLFKKLKVRDFSSHKGYEQVAGFWKTVMCEILSYLRGKKVPPLPPHLKLRVFIEVNFTIQWKTEFRGDSPIPWNFFYKKTFSIVHIFSECVVYKLCDHNIIVQCTTVHVIKFMLLYTYWTAYFDIIHIPCMFLWLWHLRIRIECTNTHKRHV